MLRRTPTQQTSSASGLISPSEKETKFASNISNGKQSFKPSLVNSSHNSSSSSSGSSSATSSTSSSNTSISKVPLIDLSSNESSRASMLNHQSSKDQEAPPIPPRNKPSSSNSNANIVESTNRPKPQIATPTQEQQHKIVAEETKPEIKPKKSFSPPIATQEESESDDDDEDPICGPAETITGEMRFVYSK